MKCASRFMIQHRRHRRALHFTGAEVQKVSQLCHEKLMYDIISRYALPMPKFMKMEFTRDGSLLTQNVLFILLMIRISYFRPLDATLYAPMPLE